MDFFVFFFCVHVWSKCMYFSFMYLFLLDLLICYCNLTNLINSTMSTRRNLVKGYASTW
ncbi:hypothetical protein C2G38_2058847 [Gigaspora rosea]|uniref:Uncharacterized protein n=1 Tax=Gigaspora rosea TaxID=44941 RepID=A0A397W3H9_9GLOM|nr:hypothetical protein C2G38_2058847 [Gigaspora rosea]